MATSCTELCDSWSSSDGQQQTRVDREKTCPMLIRVFPSEGRHHSLAYYQDGQTPVSELHLYSWMDATLDELSKCVARLMPDVASEGTHLVFARVFPDKRPECEPGSYAMKEVGVVCCGVAGLDDGKTLAQAKFCPGDFLDVAVLPGRRPRYSY
ncbi:histone deacetylase complex subunit SAP18 [Schistocerca nitens]|uniref:histone deacetylase complex subunit SAP18 n=1 Tax=Schistocerca nitens TaxID=7011 RepID=UPI00211796E9|nr:histone deacetylase complex subunit SAP18 [Schistocerca nitens]